MTHREEFVPPCCPVCTSRDEVQRAHGGPTPWLCGTCWTTFWGGQDEWDRMAPARKQWDNQQERKAERAEDS